MKLVAVSVVKNEADIIEAFVRHTTARLDRHLIFDHQSTDGTREILAELVREGLPVELFAGQAATNLQQQRSNFLTRVAFSEYDADWVFPLDADEILVAADRPAIERALAGGSADQPLALGLHNFLPTQRDDQTIQNPVVRLQYRQRHADGTCKVVVPRALGIRPEVSAGKGSHTLFEGERAIEARRTDAVWLAHFALRDPVQQMLRVATAELQRLSRGRIHAGLDTHYRLGFQLLAENPEEFLALVEQPSESLVLDPVPYASEPLRYSRPVSALSRGVRAFLPFLEMLARNHGRLVDGVLDPGAAVDGETIQRLDVAKIAPIERQSREAFSGFNPIAGWEIEEGPVPSAFLPKFHWATAPETVLELPADGDCTAWLTAELLTYVDGQVTTVVLNGADVHRHAFAHVNQKDMLSLPLKLHAGANHLVFRHDGWLRSAHDPRKLAVIFLGLRVTPEVNRGATFRPETNERRA